MRARLSFFEKLQVMDMSKLCMGRGNKDYEDVARLGFSYEAEILNLRNFLPNRFNVGDSNIYIS